MIFLPQKAADKSKLAVVKEFCGQILLVVAVQSLYYLYMYLVFSSNYFECYFEDAIKL
jgi:hypothetical protein